MKITDQQIMQLLQIANQYIAELLEKKSYHEYLRTVAQLIDEINHQQSTEVKEVSK